MFRPTTPASIEDTLTKKGLDFEKVFVEMRRWGGKWMRS